MDIITEVTQMMIVIDCLKWMLGNLANLAGSPTLYPSTRVGVGMDRWSIDGVQYSGD